MTKEIKGGKDIPKASLHDFILGSLPRLADEACINEISWMLYWLKELELSLPAPIGNRILELRSSVCALVLADLNSQNLVNGKLDFAPFSSSANENGLKSGIWLALYELTKKDWWPDKVDSKYLTGHKFFGDLLKAEVSFYDEGISMPEPKSKSPFVSLFKASLALESGYEE